jgi:hypothetical protein
MSVPLSVRKRTNSGILSFLASFSAELLREEQKTRNGELSAKIEALRSQNAELMEKAGETRKRSDALETRLERLERALEAKSAR